MSEPTNDLTQAEALALEIKGRFGTIAYTMALLLLPGLRRMVAEELPAWLNLMRENYIAGLARVYREMSNEELATAKAGLASLLTQAASSNAEHRAEAIEILKTLGKAALSVLIGAVMARVRKKAIRLANRTDTIPKPIIICRVAA